MASTDDKGFKKSCILNKTEAKAFNNGSLKQKIEKLKFWYIRF